MGLGSIIGGALGGPAGAAIGGLIEGKNAVRNAQGQLVAADQDSIALYNQQQAEAKKNLTPYLNTGTAANMRLGQLLGVAPTFDPLSAYKEAVNGTTEWGTERQHYTVDPTTGALVKGKVAGASPSFYTMKNLDLVGINSDVANKKAGATVAPGEYGSLLDPFTGADLADDPGYNFRLTQGETALDRANSARGNFLSGSAIKGALDFNSGLASQEFNNAFARDTTNKQNIFGMLSGTSAAGQNAAGTLANLGANYAQNVSGMFGNIGNTQAAGTIQQANLNNQAGATMGSIFGNLYGQYQAQQPIKWNPYGS
ncbi:hypothetical protein J0X19_11790 [Hymenobacter sp. BT186]|uniref:DNA transfer protein p32 n=1 Tax=Hymenobacter telluris TaxID=2816474 RepID=A0A939J9B3_9BACT|nr:hypothetical protein [Hymenobacter telluris]MBO0358629.1 hypothetical protein [Hymenobacter telluris]MBW3374655.1 hypothetical protein [Hymenobacter norwichensis]